jgi:GTP-binding protein HflX
VHVIDASNPDWPRQRQSVEAILGELNLDERPVIIALNKVDRLDAAARAALPADAIDVSAKNGEGIDRLRAAIAERLPR